LPTAFPGDAEPRPRRLRWPQITALRANDVGPGANGEDVMYIGGGLLLLIIIIIILILIFR
jgi:hypothetical protein